MDIKNCQQCGKEYEAKSKTGQEQKFCSRSCRNKHHNERRKENLFEKFKNEYVHKPTISGNENRFTERNIESDRISHNGLSFEKTIELIQKNAELTAENKRLMDKLEVMQREIHELESEVEELDGKIGENESAGLGSIGAIAKEYAPYIASWIMSKNSKTESHAKTKAA